MSLTVKEVLGVQVEPSDIMIYASRILLRCNKKSLGILLSLT